MAEKNDGGDKTEKPTAKRLRDSRKKGDVAKSKDVSPTVVLFGWLVSITFCLPLALSRLSSIMNLSLEFMTHPSIYGLETVGLAATAALVWCLLAVMGPTAVLGLLTEFAQVGPVLSTEKMKPKLDHMDPSAGLKRMFSVDNLFELAKSLIKTAVLVAVVWLLVASRFGDLVGLARGGPDGALSAMGQMIRELLLTTMVVFALLSAADIAYQRFSFTKKMRMSRRDLRREQKDDQGDPYVRQQRRRLAQEWAGRNAVEATRGAAALVMNPTHIAVALDYDPREHPAPIVAAKGQDMLAQRMRQAAEEEGVPIIHNVAVARALNARGVVDDVVPSDMFAAVAEVIVWARRVRDEAERRRKCESDRVDGGGTSP